MVRPDAPWHMLRRTTFMPLSISFSRISSESVAGPMVQMICKCSRTDGKAPVI